MRTILKIVLLSSVLTATIVHADDPAASSAGDVIDFERHVVPLFGRLGCNSAACHGAFGGGKGDLQLSLFGYSAKMDFQAVSRRIDHSHPEDSLLLRKPSGLEDHEGGVRFEQNSEEFRNIYRWIKNGALWREGSGVVQTLTVEPPQVVLGDETESQPLVVTAHFADGTREVVTQLCGWSSRDEGVAVVAPDGRVSRSSHGSTSVIVSYGNAFAAVRVLAPYPSTPSKKVDRVHPSNLIDAQIDGTLVELNITPSGPTTDEEFLRRVTLDTIGTIPSPEDVLQFCASKDPNKRERKIDELLSHPRHAALWATRMCDITKCDVNAMGEDRLMGARRAQMWHDWFRKRFETNTSYAEIVRGIVTSTSRDGREAAEWIQREEQRIHRSRQAFDDTYADRDTLDLYWRRVGDDADATLKQNAELTAVAFTGVRLNCAQCHKHPFDRWSQDDYAAFANIFANVVCGSSTETNTVVLNELSRRRKLKREGQTVEPLPRIREVFVSEELGRPLSGSRPGVKVAPRALNSQDFDGAGDLRQQFYEWLIAPENSYFAPSFVNRVWAVYFGIGLVDPVDDFSVTNPPSHPRLLKALAADFRESGFDIRKLEKRILMSATYQRSAVPNESNRDDRRHFARQYVRPLLAEVALDAINTALGTTEDLGDAARKGALAIEVGTNEIQGDAGKALKFLGRGSRETTCDCDRRTETDLRQFIFLANAPSVTNKIREGAIRELLELENQPLVDRLYLRILGRHPDPTELERATRHLSDPSNRETAFDDLVWALVNSREFITNH